MKIVPLLAHIFFLTIVAMPGSLFAQQGEAGNWIMYFSMNKVSDKFSIHSEVQYRNHTIVPVNIEQLLLRAGLNYHFSDKAFVTGGYGYIAGYQFESEQKNPESEEHRIWQQLILKNNLGRLKFEHRYRVEQRWANSDYGNRFRYRLMLFVPINKPIIEEGTVYLGLYDEIFINGETEYFDRNRLYGAIGYQFNKSTGVQIGALHQQENDFGKWYLQLALFLNLDLRKHSELMNNY